MTNDIVVNQVTPCGQNIIFQIIYFSLYGFCTQFLGSAVARAPILRFVRRLVSGGVRANFWLRRLFDNVWLRRLFECPMHNHALQLQTRLPGAVPQPLKEIYITLSYFKVKVILGYLWLWE